MTDVIINKSGTDNILKNSKSKDDIIKFSGKAVTIKATKIGRVIELERSLKIMGHDVIIDSKQKNSKLIFSGILEIESKG